MDTKDTTVKKAGNSMQTLELGLHRWEPDPVRLFATLLAKDLGHLLLFSACGVRGTSRNSPQVRILCTVSLVLPAKHISPPCKADKQWVLVENAFPSRSTWVTRKIRGCQQMIARAAGGLISSLRGRIPSLSSLVSSLSFPELWKGYKMLHLPK